ncbi:hypothetical protein PBY51_018534 [Eleginops maclovinus]|uniref:Uncharacterized protein n=1 Tax=Eleginops maclovinus TaxID=56733 RepID=A0AAN7Y0L2_ELEMC|nr:hypothetical protein PBY51_018534 [Eleginops maclovinus]
MFSWVVKVVPKPPEPPPKKVEEQKLEKPVAPPPAATPPPSQEKRVTFVDECKQEALKDDKQEVQAAGENGPEPVAQSGVFMWFNSSVPKPALSPNLCRANSITKEENTTTSKPEDEKGMIAWISGGLEKVVPQPDLKRKETPAEPEQHTEASAAAPEKPAEPQITVEEREEHTHSRPLPPRMMDWIKQGLEKVVPQPESRPKAEAPAAAKAPEPAPEPKAANTEKSLKEGELKANIMGWVVSELGRMLPQPALKMDAGGDEVQNISIVQQKTDLLLEDVEQEVEQDVEQEVEQDENIDDKQNEKKLQSRDAETQMDQSTPVMHSAKKEAEEANLEERPQQDPLEAARIAEEIARRAAEEAVRQLQMEQSAKSMEMLPVCHEQLPNIQEEENEDLKSVKEDSPAEEKTSPPSTHVEPASEKRDLESPKTIPPEPESPTAETTTTDQVEAAESECGVPEVCIPIKSFLLRFPLAAECLERGRKLMHDHNLAPPALSMPTPPPELAMLTQELQQLSTQARQCCTSIASRLARLNPNSQHPQQP